MLNVRIGRFAGVVALAVGLGFVAVPSGAGAEEGLPPLVTTLQTVLDTVGDVLNTVTSSLFDNPRADITGASVEYAPGWIRMKVQLKNTVDPLKDPAWSDRSDAEWIFDTNGDGKPDYTVEFSSDKGELYGAVFDAAQPSDADSVCEADSASYSPTDGYTMVVDPACLKNPQQLGYAVAMYFDTNPKDDKAPLVTDRVPDQGFKDVAAPVQPQQAGAPAPAPAAPSPAPAPVAPKVPAGAPVAGKAPVAAPAAPRNPAAARAPGPVPSGAPGVTGPVPDPAHPDTLARTGAASPQHALVGLGIMLLGAGLLVMTRPVSRPGLAGRLPGH